MATRQVLIVFVLPVIFSLFFGSAVLFGILQSDRESGIRPTSDVLGGLFQNSQIEIIGLAEQYAPSDPVQIKVRVGDPAFDCGDLYITIYADSGDVLTQGTFLEQCYGSSDPVIPVGGPFSKIIAAPGSYEVDVQLISKQLKNISSKETFTVK